MSNSEHTAKCFDCGQAFTYADDDARVGATYAFCSEDCRSSFMAGLGA